MWLKLGAVGCLQPVACRAVGCVSAGGRASCVEGVRVVRLSAPKRVLASGV